MHNSFGDVFNISERIFNSLTKMYWGHVNTYSTHSTDVKKEFQLKPHYIFS